MCDGKPRRHGAGRHAGAHVVGPAREDDRDPRPEHQARGVRLGQEGQVLGQHVAGLEIRDQKDVGAPGDRLVLSGEFQRQGRVVSFTYPTQPDWPFYGVLGDSTFTMYGVPAIYKSNLDDQTSTRRTYVFDTVTIQ